VNCVFLLVFFTTIQSDAPTKNLSQAHVQLTENGTPRPTGVENWSKELVKEDEKTDKPEKNSKIAKVSDYDESEDDSDVDDIKPKKKASKGKAAKEKKSSKKELEETVKEGLSTIKDLKKNLDKSNKRIVSLLERRDKVQHVLRWSNPFFLLGAYPRVGLEYFNSYPDGRPYYEKYNYGVINDPDYCEIVDFYNLAHPENMFDQMNFFTDYAKNGLARTKVIRQIGVDTMTQVSRYMDKKVFYSAQFHLNPTITNYFTKRVDLHIYHMIGKNFNCATQMYNHIPGHGVLKRKDMIVDSVNEYAKKFVDRSHCFNEKSFFPYSYRLYIEEECHAFFNKINSAEYIEKLKVEPIQYVMKVGFGAHRAMGVFLLDKNETELRKEEYGNGELCGVLNQSLIAQTYITNPLLLDLNNKFDFRVYMLVASTNPLIVYYHDGFLRVTLQSYDKHSTDKSIHLTNTQLAKDLVAEAKATGANISGMTPEQLLNYQMWTFEKLESYLYETKKTDDKNWSDNYLRPAFHKAFIHAARLSGHAFWKQSNVYEMFGLDFMLDDELNLWFIECNASPQLIGTNELKTNFLVKMLKDLFEIQYGLYRSRMKRVLAVVKKMNVDATELGNIDYENFREEYALAAKNRFEPEYEISPDNTFKLIMDENLSGSAAYMDILEPECVDY
jgi:hypothetical protein